jgi:hypothetical protein
MRRTLSRPAPASRSEAALLQRGNRAAPPLVAPRFSHNFSSVPIRAKLKVGAAGDAFEREADRVAEQVMKTPEPRLQRACECGGSCSDCSKDDEPPAVRRKSSSGDRVAAVASSVRSTRSAAASEPPCHAPNRPASSSTLRQRHHERAPPFHARPIEINELRSSPAGSAPHSETSVPAGRREARARVAERERRKRMRPHSPRFFSVQSFPFRE